MRFRPKNPNDSLPNRHTFIWGTSGCGKSQLLVNGGLVPMLKGTRAIIWDDVGRLPGHYYRSRASFLRALMAASAGGGGFRIGYGGLQSPSEFEWFCEVVWSQLDGHRETFVACEELAAVSATTGEALPAAALLLNQGRKYGARFIGTTQRPQAVSKTFFDGCDIQYVGRQKTPAMRRKAAEVAGVTPDQIAALQNLQFYKDGDGASGQLVQVRYRAPGGGIHWHD